MVYSNQWNRAEVLGGWLELVRLPNLFTIPGDILAGASLALISKGEIPFIPPVVIISLLLYMSGLILNDYCDREIDKKQRPNRPIPSGRVSPHIALTTALALMSLAVIISYLIGSVFGVTLGLLVLIVLYNGPARKIPWLGMLVMGLCRGCNVLLGAALGKNPFSYMVLIGAGGETLYVAAVSALAYNETKGPPSLTKQWLPFLSLFTFSAFLFPVEEVSIAGIFMLLVTFGWVFSVCRTTGRDSKQVPEKIGELIHGLILVQCTLIAFSMGKNVGFGVYHLSAIVFLFFLLTLSGWTAKKFYRS